MPADRPLALFGGLGREAVGSDAKVRSEEAMRHIATLWIPILASFGIVLLVAVASNVTRQGSGDE